MNFIIKNHVDHVYHGFFFHGFAVEINHLESPLWHYDHQATFLRCLQSRFQLTFGTAQVAEDFLRLCLHARLGTWGLGLLVVVFLAYHLYIIPYG